MVCLTKSRFLQGVQCPKRLWLAVYKPPETEQGETTQQLNGRAVDLLARRLRPGRVIALAQGLDEAIAETAVAMGDASVPVLYQPAFRHEDLVVIADRLSRRGERATLTEVKSATGVKPHYLADVGFQALVLRQCGVNVERVLLAHIDSRFELRRAGDYDGFLVEQDLTTEVEAALPQIDETVRLLRQVLAGPGPPRVAMGAQCLTPQACPFIAHCTEMAGGAPQFPLEVLPRGGKLIAALRAEGYRDLMDVPEVRLSGVLHRRVHHATVSGEVYLDPSATHALRRYHYPMAYLDFETIGLAVPEFVGTRPYEPWPFQWSLHVEAADGTVRHAEFLAVDHLGELDALAMALLAALPESGPVFAYNASFERGVLTRLAERLPQQANALRAIANRLVDLLPVTRAAYYHRDMRGSWSIKSVLPTLAPELDYAKLANVREGDGAQRALLQLRSGALDAAQRRDLEAALRSYCERDTWALVVLRRFLCGEPAPEPGA